MPAIETSIWLALRGRVESLVLSPVLPVAWPNQSFSAPPTGYLRVTWIPNINRRLGVGSSDAHRRLSLLQIDVFAAKNQNPAVALEIAGLVAEHFPADLALRSNGRKCRVTKTPDIAQPLPTDTHWMVPVTVSIDALI